MRTGPIELDAEHPPAVVTAKALLRYLVTGGMAAAADIAGFALLSSWRVPVLLGATCSFVVATVVNFLLTSRYVFRLAPTRRRYVVFLAAATLGLLTNVGLTYVGAVYLEVQPVLAKAFSIGVTFLMNFWLNARVVFRDGSA